MSLRDAQRLKYSANISCSSSDDSENIDDVFIEVCKWRRRKHLTSNNLHLADILATDANVPALIGFRTGSETQLTDAVSPSLSADSSDENKENEAGSKTKKKDSTSSNRSIWYISSSSDPVNIDVANLATHISSSVPSAISDFSDDHPPVERKLSRTKPKGTIEIEVPLDSTLNSLAAHYDTTPSELIKLNRLGSRMVFPGQMLLIPDPDYVSSSEPSSPEISTSPVFSLPVDERPRIDIPIVKMADKPPSRIPGHAERQTSLSSPQEKKDVDVIPHKLTDEDVQYLDQECFERFIKINVKHITDGQGVVNGTLLVTPNAVMFDPNVSDPLVIEHGPEKYGMITPMDMVISAAMYHDIAAMRTRCHKQDDEGHSSKHEIYHAKDCPLHHSGSAVFYGEYHGDETDNANTDGKTAVRRSSTIDSLASSTTACSCGALSREQSLCLDPDVSTVEESSRDTNSSGHHLGEAMDGRQTSADDDDVHLVFDDGGEVDSHSDGVHAGVGRVKQNDDADQSIGDEARDSVNGIRSDDGDNDAEPFPNVGVEPSPDGLKTSVGVAHSSEGVKPSASGTKPSPDGVKPSPDGVKPPDGVDPPPDGVEPSLDGVKLSPVGLKSSSAVTDSSFDGINDSHGGLKHSPGDGHLSNNSVSVSKDTVTHSAVNDTDSLDTGTTRNIPGEEDAKEIYSTSDSIAKVGSRIDGVMPKSDSGVNDASDDDIIGDNHSRDVGSSGSDSAHRSGVEVKDVDTSNTDIHVLNVDDSSRLMNEAVDGTLRESTANPDGKLVDDSTATSWAIKSLNLPNTLLGGTKTENVENGESRIGNIIYLPVEKNTNGEMVVKATSVTQASAGLLTTTATSGELGGERDSDGGMRSGSDSSVGVRAIKSSAHHLSSFVNYATGLFRSNVDDRTNVKDISEVMGKATPTMSDGSKMAVGVGSSSYKSQPHLEVANAIRLEDKPELFQTFDSLELIARPATHVEDPPLYLCLRVGHPKNKEVSQTCPIESYRSNKKKPEYWFSIPRAKVDALYAFFVQWTPDIYGDQDEIDPEIRGFVVIDDEEKTEEENLEIIDEHFASIQKIRKDWEIISKEEALRRMSTIDDDSLQLPEMNGETILLSEEHLKELSKNLPPRTIGYAWTLTYSTELHGFSLKTLYRYMYGIDSPILLVVMDTNEHVFGAVTSCAIKMSDHFYGTGESFLFTFYPEFKVFHWTGENNFFLKGNQESLAIGAGQGLFGLWFDGDLYHGRSHRCETFDNDVLTDTEDFVVKGLEAWAFF
ncbi:oxidation resistance protein 1-like isoform X3 [Gigantopelta aegis]|uniref:oxidation resistance protein 1-like isoform X3 n=1 Tax=Gigantopelta aegis TaxID=1735272 RepID=UPI001B88A857|nr:oxidation resistance protein 1-like isoform X3 [Gigantopelta aegis]